MSDLATIRATVRTDLHDEDPTDERWTDAELDRHIRRALLEYSLRSPLEAKSTLQTVPGSRDLDVSALASRVRIVAAEFPTGEYPPGYISSAHRSYPDPKSILFQLTEKLSHTGQ